MIPETDPSTTAVLSQPSFIDVSDWIARHRDFGASATDDAYLASRIAMPLAQGPVSAGLLRLSPGKGKVARQQGDEFLYLIEGDLALRCADGDVLLGDSDAATVTSGAELFWQTRQGALVLFMRRDSATTASPSVIRCNLEAALEPSGAPLAELLIGPTPQCRNASDFKSADGEFMCGTWDSTPYTRRPMVYRQHELMVLLEGSVRFDDTGGRSQTFSTGQIVLVEQGAECGWDSRCHVKKLYCIHRPA
jgi:uncharacterized cupin superfamily protein